ncbi:MULTISPECIES: hypothetical protein [unclassified Inquilinus]|uniref:hypothetical protein n=1 Tax=unclassified Inquilinus TaxID=2645927 RepID=UPI003F90D023
MRNPEVEVRKLKLRFRAVTARIERVQRRRSIAHRLLRAVPVLVVTLGLVVGGFMVSPWADGHRPAPDGVSELRLGAAGRPGAGKPW